jgi:hypothetical protein
MNKILKSSGTKVTKLWKQKIQKSRNKSYKNLGTKIQEQIFQKSRKKCLKNPETNISRIQKLKLQ